MATKERCRNKKTVIAALRVPMSRLALSQSLQHAPHLYFRFEQVALCDLSNGLPIWIGGHDRETIETALGSDPSVTSYTRIHQKDREHLYDIVFHQAALCAHEFFLDYGGSILNGYGADGTWKFKVRFPSREKFSEAYKRVEENDIEISCLQIKTCQRLVRQSILSNAQFEAVKQALDLGYFNVPRDATLQELADRIGISHQAASERLRRAEKKMFSSLVSNRARGSLPMDYPELTV